MDEVRVIVQVENLRLHNGPKYDTIHGVIFFQVGDFSFPDSLWDDFVVRILGWWITTMNALVHSRTDEQRFFAFMDGAYHVNIDLLNDSLCHLAFGPLSHDIDEACQGIIIVMNEATVRYDELLAHLIEVAQSVVSKADVEGWQTRDLETLKNLITST